MNNKKIILNILAMLLLMSLWFHSIEFQHKHPHSLFGSSQEAVLHGEDKKISGIIALIKFRPVQVLDILKLVCFLLCIYFANIGFVKKYRNYFLEFLSRGRLQPKLCA